MQILIIQKENYSDKIHVFDTHLLQQSDLLYQLAVDSNGELFFPRCSRLVLHTVYKAEL